MTNRRHLFCLLLSLSLAVLISVGPFAAPIAAQEAAKSQNATAAADLTASLATIEKAIDDKRKELGIPGVSLVIVKDDKVTYMKALGAKDFEHNLPVTPDTLFAIGSSTKAFTAMAAVMSADEGKLSLDDSPKKFLPYFKLRDPETDAKITIRDLLSHRSGLNRTDLAMVTGMLSKEELIRVVGMAKPTAKLGEKFQYQNVMYAAAGEAVARAQNSTWEKVIVDKIFKPLGMNVTNTTVAATQKAADFSFGYEYNSTTRQTRRLPMREIPSAAPAGAINSNARDMAQWLRFMLAGGVIDGKRLVSEKGFNELLTKQIKVAGDVDYGLGWVLHQRGSHKVAEHGGSIDGFNAQVALMPDQKLGLVLLSNVTSSSLGNFVMETVWSNLVGRGSTPPAQQTDSGPAVDPQKEVGTYQIVEAGVNIEVSMKDGKLLLTAPSQPPYPMQNLGGRRYKLGEPAPQGFFATFRPIKGNETQSEMYLEQPQGNLVLPKIVGDAVSAASAKTNSEYSGPLKEMLGSYEHEQGKIVVEITVRDGKVALVVPGQPPYPLAQKEKDKLNSPSLPGTYWVDVKRDAEGKVSGIMVNQPEGQFALRRLPDTAVEVSVDELIPKMTVAAGGKENLLKHKSSTATIEVDYESQGLTGEGVVNAKAPSSLATRVTLMALGKKIGSVVNYFDGNSGGQTTSFTPEEIYTGKRLEDVKRAADFYSPLNWKKNFKTITIKRKASVGGEEVYVVEKAPEKGNNVTDYVSTKSFLLLKRDTIISNDTANVELPQTVTYSDYRLVDGVMVPYKAAINDAAIGDILIRVKEVKFNVEIPDSVFQKPPK